MSRIVVGISGASGSIYAVRLLQHLKNCPGVSVHLVVSDAAKKVYAHEYEHILSFDTLISEYCDHYHEIADIGASIASGSFITAGMIIAPCTVRTMSEIASCTATNLLTRAADVTLKERRKLVLMLRDTPFHLGHLKNMVAVTEMGAIVAPPIPSFYNVPESILDIVDHSVSRVLSMFGISQKLKEWRGLGQEI